MSTTDGSPCGAEGGQAGLWCAVSCANQYAGGKEEGGGVGEVGGDDCPITSHHHHFYPPINN